MGLSIRLIISTFVQCSGVYKVYRSHKSNYIEKGIVPTLQRASAQAYALELEDSGHVSRFLTPVYSSTGLPMLMGAGHSGLDCPKVWLILLGIFLQILAH